MKLTIILAALLGLLIPAGGPSAPHPTLTCKGYRAPRIECEALHVYPFRPDWTVWTGDQRTDVEDGVVVYLTVPERRFARIEMCVVPDLCVSAWAGWFGNKALFHD